MRIVITYASLSGVVLFYAIVSSGVTVDTKMSWVIDSLSTRILKESVKFIHQLHEFGIIPISALLVQYLSQLSGALREFSLEKWRELLNVIERSVKCYIKEKIILDTKG